MMLGHASGLAASMSIALKKPLHELPVANLQTRLVEQNQIISAKAFEAVAKGIDP